MSDEMMMCVPDGSPLTKDYVSNVVSPILREMIVTNGGMEACRSYWKESREKANGFFFGWVSCRVHTMVPLFQDNLQHVVQCLAYSIQTTFDRPTIAQEPS